MEDTKNEGSLMSSDKLSPKQQNNVWGGGKPGMRVSDSKDTRYKHAQIQALQVWQAQSQQQL